MGWAIIVEVALEEAAEVVVELVVEESGGVPLDVYTKQKEKKI